MSYALRALRRPQLRDPRVLFHWRAGMPWPGSFSRGSAGTYIDPAGVIREAATNVPRIVWLDLDGDGVRETPVYRGEEGRTNAWTWSEALDNAAWTKAGASVSANVAVAPDGTSTADLLVESALNEEHYITRGAPTITNETLQTFSFCVRAGPGGRWVRIRTSNKAGLDISSYFDPATGMFGTVNAAHTLRVVDALPGGWYRVACTYNAGTGAGSGFARLNVATGNGGALIYTGDGASGLYLWGLQYEADRPFASTYMRTDASTFTRDPDTLYVDLPPGIAPESDVALYVRARKGFANNGGGSESGFVRRLWQIGAANGLANPRTITIFNGSDVQLQQFAGDGSVSTASIALATPADSLVEAVAVYRRNRSGRLILSVGGGAPVGAERAAPSWSISDWAGRRLYFGSAGDSGGRSALDFASAVILRGPFAGTDAQILDECREAAA